ncbi:tetratricopeptide repeat protein [Desulfoplanes formicivorans]|uniref:Tetratricopeptide domain-containing protein n=1 Tax=Desulfoplanes formicivorans TaxID=1592317 RepID=A0A194ACW7_9BACT|nr:tetratricopeptide repeat protein [Desulfoplanes formicivorans]GAU07952.1 tetratricopeptide domain-containing protein [Desulfoplanes formicivorans]
MALWLPGTALGMTQSWHHYPQKERLVFAFDRTVPTFSLKRTGRTAITLTLPPSIWNQEPRPAPIDLSVSRMITNITPSERAITIHLKSPAFGFIYFPLPGDHKLILDLFHDPLGAQWQPSKMALQKKAQQQGPSGKESPKAPARRAHAAPQEITPEPSGSTASTQTVPLPPTVQPKKGQSVVINATALHSSGDIPDNTGPKSPGTLRFKVKFQTAEEAFGDAHTPLATAPASRPTSGRAKANKTIARNQQTTHVRTVAQDSSSQHDQHTESSSKDNPSGSPTNQNDKAASFASPPTDATTNATAAPSFKERMTTAKGTLQNGEIDAALDILQDMLDQPALPDVLGEEALYLKAEALFQKFHNDLDSRFQEVMSAFQQAISFNPQSPRLPSALLSMGLINVKVNNIPEAQAYFNLIRSKYPHDTNVPLTYYYMGEHYLNAKDYQQAADRFQYVVQNYPDNAITQSCAVGLTKALKELGYFKQAFEIMDYVQKRWPRYYLKDPAFLMLAGYIDFKNKRLSAAKEEFWTYVNLTPQAKDVDIALARLGDIYVMTGKTKAARQIYEKTAEQFPDQEGGLIAKMRLAEEGVFDKPSIDTMFSVFDKPYSLRPQQVYSQIIATYPDSPLAPVAQLKLAMWQLWNDQYRDTLQAVADFINNYPQQELTPKALEVGNKAFAQFTAKAIERDRFKDIVSLWNTYPFLHQSPAPMARLAVATSLWKTGHAIQALTLAAPLLANKRPREASSGPALDLALAILVQSQSWQDIIKLSQEIKDWKLSANRKRQFEYTLALAHQNLGQTDQSHLLWKQLAADVELPDAQRAYALYFMAKHAEQAQDLRNEYNLAHEALSLFLSMPEQDLPKIRDCLDMLIRVTSTTRRHQEALSWGLECEKYMTKADPSWPAHMYTLANLFKLNQDNESWKNKLVAITKMYPDSIYSKMAARDLEADQLQEKLQPFN